MSGCVNAKSPKLVLNDICKNFGGVVAAKEICLEIHGGEVLGLIGPNGAGKTTLINLITGVYKADRVTSFDELRSAVLNFQVGDTVEVIVYRSGQQYRVELTLSEYKG